MPNTVIALKKSATVSAIPVDLANGELAINYADGKLFYKHANGTIAIFASGGDNFATINANTTLIVADTPGDILTIVPGDNISIVGDAVNDKITISANILPPFLQANIARDHANAAFAQANAGGAGGTAKANVGNIDPTGNTTGTLWWNTDLGRLLVYYTDVDGSQWVDASPTGDVGPVGPTGADGPAGPAGPTGNTAPRAITIEYPQANDTITMFYSFESFTLSEIRSVLLGSSGASVTFSVRYATSMAVTGTEVIASGITTTNTTNGQSNTSFTNGTIPSGNFVWVTISAATNTTNALHISMR